MSRAAKSPHDPGQATESAEDVNHVYAREHIEERTVGIRRQVEPLRPQIQPSQVLADDKYQAKQHRHVEPQRGRGSVAFLTAHGSRDPTASQFKSKAAGDERQSIEKQNWGEDYMVPV